MHNEVRTSHTHQYSLYLNCIFLPIHQLPKFSNTVIRKNIIKNYSVREKIKVKTPDVIDNVVKCSNPVCITNNEQVATKFYVAKKDPLKIKCHYCERIMGKADLEII